MAWWGWFFAVAVAAKVIARNFWKFGEDGRIGEVDLFFFCFSFFFFFFFFRRFLEFGIRSFEWINGDGNSMEDGEWKGERVFFFFGFYFIGKIWMKIWDVAFSTVEKYIRELVLFFFFPPLFFSLLSLLLSWNVLWGNYRGMVSRIAFVSLTFYMRWGILARYVGSVGFNQRRYWYFFWSKSKRFDEINFLLSVEICMMQMEMKKYLEFI